MCLNFFKKYLLSCTIVFSVLLSAPSLQVEFLDDADFNELVTKKAVQMDPNWTRQAEEWQEQVVKLLGEFKRCLDKLPAPKPGIVVVGLLEAKSAYLELAKSFEASKHWDRPDLFDALSKSFGVLFSKLVVFLEKVDYEKVKAFPTRYRELGILSDSLLPAYRSNYNIPLGAICTYQHASDAQKFVALIRPSQTYRSGFHLNTNESIQRFMSQIQSVSTNKNDKSTIHRGDPKTTDTFTIYVTNAQLPGVETKIDFNQLNTLLELKVTLTYLGSKQLGNIGSCAIACEGVKIRGLDSSGVDLALVNLSFLFQALREMTLDESVSDPAGKASIKLNAPGFINLEAMLINLASLIATQISSMEEGRFKNQDEPNVKNIAQKMKEIVNKKTKLNYALQPYFNILLNKIRALSQPMFRESRRERNENHTLDSLKSS